MDYKDILNIVSLLSTFDYTFILTLFTFLIASAAFYFAVISFRPKLHLEIKSVLSKDLLSSYDLVISNNGNVLAENIKLSYDEKSLNNALNHLSIKKDLKDNDFGSFAFIKKILSKDIKYLGSGCERKGTFLCVESENPQCPLKFNVPFYVTLSYVNSITKIKYKESVELELFSHSSLTNYFMNDELGYDLEQIQKKLKDIEILLRPINMKEVVYNGVLKSDQLNKAKKVFSSLNKSEKIDIFDLFKNCNGNEQKFKALLKKLLLKNSGISKKINRLNVDEYRSFYLVIEKYSSNFL